MKGAGADLHVVGLQQDASLPSPVLLQRLNQALKARDVLNS
jgi:hypothetical protein